MDINNHPIVIVMIVAVLSALLAEIRIGVRIPAVLWEMVWDADWAPHTGACVSRLGPVAFHRVRNRRRSASRAVLSPDIPLSIH
jgi:hypothetical protein